MIPGLSRITGYTTLTASVTWYDVLAVILIAGPVTAALVLAFRGGVP